MRISRKAAIGLLAGGAATALTGIAVGAAAEDDVSAALAGKIDPSRPKNVILLVGDGMGDSEVTLGRYYGKGAAGRLNMDRLTFRGSSIHYVLRPGPGPNYAPNYVGDSAPTATAWSTGKRTQDGRLSQGPSSADTVPGSTRATAPTWRSRATAARRPATSRPPRSPTRRRPGRARTSPSAPARARPTRARPARRRPRRPRAPGLGSIAEQQVDEGFDLYLGGGLARYRQPLTDGGADDVVDYAEANGYRFVGTKQDLAAIDDLGDGKVLGLFNNGNMTTEYAPLFARTKAYYDANPNRDVQVQGGSETTRCQPQNRGTEPSLSEMTAKAIELLEDDPDGFTLQVEGASIDKRDHAADVCGQIGETLGFDDAVGVALDYQREHPDTLVIVTADHAHTSQMTYTHRAPGHRHELRDGADRRRRADPRLLRDGGHRPRRDDERLAAPHRRAGAGLGLRPAGGEHPGHDRPDRHLRRAQRQGAEQAAGWRWLTGTGGAGPARRDRAGRPGRTARLALPVRPGRRARRVVTDVTGATAATAA